MRKIHRRHRVGSRQSAASARGQHVRHIAVLDLTWDNDQMGCTTAQRTVLDVFSEKYDATCKSAVISTKRPRNGSSNGASNGNVAIRFVTEALITFRTRWDGPSVLMILVYSGHAAVSPIHHKMQWAGRIDDFWPTLLSRPILEWDEIKGNAKSLKGGSSLCLFDCPCAAASELDQDAASPEVFGAAHPRCRRVVRHGPHGNQ